MGNLDPPAHPRSCRACGEPLRPSASLCPQCGSWQNWKRHLQFGTVVLSLLIALISVAGLVLSTALDALLAGPRLHLELERPELQLSFGGGGAPGAYYRSLNGVEIGATLLIANAGNRPAHLRQVTVTYTLARAPEGLAAAGGPLALPQVRNLVAVPQQSIAIAPGAVVFHELAVFENPGLRFPVSNTDYRDGRRDSAALFELTRGRLKVEFIHHDLQPESITLELPLVVEAVE